MEIAMKNQTDAKNAFRKAWPHIVDDCRQVLGSELHYQAMIYHCLRHYGKVPIDQIGMNVKMRIDDPVSEYFKHEERTRADGYQGLVEPTPDIVIFKQSIEGDWRRRNYENSLRKMLMAIEVKASERDKGRLQPGEIIPDIEKLAAHREEVIELGASVAPVMLIVDTAPDDNERMTYASLEKVCKHAKGLGIALFYLSPTENLEGKW